MPNKNYRAGRRKEYSVITALKKAGYEIAQRSAGSHSPIDVFAINKKLKKIIFIQVKSGYLSPREEAEILKENKLLKGSFDVKFSINYNPPL